MPEDWIQKQKTKGYHQEFSESMVLSGCAELMVVMTELTVVSEHHLFRAFSDS